MEFSCALILHIDLKCLSEEWSIFVVIRRVCYKPMLHMLSEIHNQDLGCVGWHDDPCSLVVLGTPHLFYFSKSWSHYWCIYALRFTFSFYQDEEVTSNNRNNSKNLLVSQILPYFYHFIFCNFNSYHIFHLLYYHRLNSPLNITDRIFLSVFKDFIFIWNIAEPVILK